MRMIDRRVIDTQKSIQRISDVSRRTRIDFIEMMFVTM